jgi:hypothetical protein
MGLRQGRDMGTDPAGKRTQNAYIEPFVQLCKCCPVQLIRPMPYLSLPVLHPPLDGPFLPAGRLVAEIRLEQIIAAPGLETGIDSALLESLTVS